MEYLLTHKDFLIEMHEAAMEIAAAKPNLPPTQNPKWMRNTRGVTYPHSSKRQNGRIARQLREGKLSMAGV